MTNSESDEAGYGKIERKGTASERNGVEGYPRSLETGSPLYGDSLGQNDGGRFGPAILDGELAMLKRRLAYVECERDQAVTRALEWANETARARKERDEAIRQADAAQRHAAADFDAAQADLATARQSSLHYRETLIDVLDKVSRLGHPAVVQTIERELTALVKPRCRVVTSPRFYRVDEQRRAADEVAKFTHGNGFTLRENVRLELVETIAAALGMRRAEG